MNTHNPHDRLFKAAFSHPKVISNYIQHFLPQNIRQKIQLHSLKRMPGSFISPELEPFYSDIIYQCQFGKEELIISLLFEHKSTVQSHPHIQLLRYMCAAWEAELKSQSFIRPIIPIIVYHGKRKWIKRPLSDYFQHLEEALLPFVPDFEYLLTDLSQWEDEKLAEKNMGLLYNSFLLMKHYGELDYVKRSVRKFFDSAEMYIKEQKDKDLIQSFFVYFFSTNKFNPQEVKEMFEPFQPDIKKEALTTYEQIMLEGYEKGIEKGIDKVIIKAYKEGFSEAMIAKLTDLNIPALQKRLKQLGLK